MYKRKLNLLELLKKKSFFIFGPRGTGKSYWIRETLPDVPKIDLLNTSLYLKLSSTPHALESLIPNGSKMVVIDEFQKIPKLLDEVHRLIEERGIHFLLTGSSTKKLKKENANFLGGRARTQHFHPLVYAEIDKFDLQKYLSFGGLPAVYQSDEPDEELLAYVESFLKEEIQLEAYVRNLPQFSRFLKTAAICNGELVNFSQVASDAEIAASTVREYFYLLQDTLMGFLIEPWQESRKRKAIQTSKFYFFDVGIPNSIQKIHQVIPKTEAIGKSFEHWIAIELKAYLDLNRINKPLNFWRSIQKDEVDFVIPNDLALEVKAAEKVSEKMLKGLKKIQEERAFKHHILVTLDPTYREIDGIKCMDWKTFLTQLWEGGFVSK
jgi:predicted AAA+ superfamily ATPase